LAGLNQGSSPNLELVKTALDKLVDQAQMENTAVGKAEATDALVFTQDGSSAQGKAAVVSTVIGGGGYFDKTLDDVSLNRSVAVAAPTPKVTLIANFKKDLPISRTFMDDQQLSAVSKAVNQQTKTWTASRDKNAMSIYSGGFATSTTIDGAYLFSNTHTNQNGDTVDNLETGALATDTLNATIHSLRTQVSQTGVILGYEPKFLLVPSILHMTAMATSKSVLRAGTGNNDLNYFSELYPGMIVKFSPFLDSSSTTAYFVGSSQHGVVRFERQALMTKLVDWTVSEDDTYKYKLRAREEVDSIEYSGLVGSIGA
jgi:hypothetical protein